MRACGKVRRRGASRALRQATDPGPSPELGKADTRSGEGPGSVAAGGRHLSKFSAEPENLHGARSAHRIQRRVRHESRPPFRRIGVPPSVIVAAPGRLHAPCGFSGPGENPLMAPAHKRSIRHLSPSACPPFQARGKIPDRPPATGECLPFQARGKAPDRPPATGECLPSHAQGKAPRRPHATRFAYWAGLSTPDCCRYSTIASADCSDVFFVVST